MQFFLQPLSKGFRKEPSEFLRYLYRGQLANSFVVTFLAICDACTSNAMGEKECKDRLRAVNSPNLLHFF